MDWPTSRTPVIAPGQAAHLRFSLKVVEGGIVKELEFADLLARRTVVSVYMKNRTPSCDRQLDSLVRHAGAFEQAGVKVVAISRDTSGSQLRQAKAKAVGFTLASDPDDLFAKATDSLVAKSMYGRTFTGPARAAYVFDRDGTVLAVVPKVDPARHAEQVLEVLRTL